MYPPYSLFFFFSFSCPHVVTRPLNLHCVAGSIAVWEENWSRLDDGKACFFFQAVKTYLGQNNTSNRSGSRRWEASETFQSSKSVRRDMLSKDRARWTWVMVGCALIEPSCQRNDWDHTLDGWPFGDDPKVELLVKRHHQDEDNQKWKGKKKSIYSFYLKDIFTWLDILALSQLIGGFPDIFVSLFWALSSEVLYSHTWAERTKTALVWMCLARLLAFSWAKWLWATFNDFTLRWIQLHHPIVSGWGHSAEKAVVKKLTRWNFTHNFLLLHFLKYFVFPLTLFPSTYSSWVGLCLTSPDRRHMRLRFANTRMRWF